MTEVTQKRCAHCGALNNIKPFSDEQIPKCGKCGQKFDGPSVVGREVNIRITSNRDNSRQNAKTHPPSRKQAARRPSLELPTQYLNEDSSREELDAGISEIKRHKERVNLQANNYISEAQSQNSQIFHNRTNIGQEAKKAAKDAYPNFGLFNGAALVSLLACMGYGISSEPRNNDLIILGFVAFALFMYLGNREGKNRDAYRESILANSQTFHQELNNWTDFEGLLLQFNQSCNAKINELREHKKAAKKNAEKQRQRELRARANSASNRARQGSASFKAKYKKQASTQNDWSCPYCNSVKSLSSSEIDHIYPVSKGGLTTEKNTVLICFECNRDKGNSTLRSFLQSRRLNEAEVERRLMDLGKDW